MSVQSGENTPQHTPSFQFVGNLNEARPRKKVYTGRSVALLYTICATSQGVFALYLVASALLNLSQALEMRKENG